jgi:hypothetical protein
LEASVSAALFTLLTSVIAAFGSAQVVRWLLIAYVVRRALRTVDLVERKTAMKILDTITPH